MLARLSRTKSFLLPLQNFSSSAKLARYQRTEINQLYDPETVKRDEQILLDISEVIDQPYRDFQKKYLDTEELDELIGHPDKLQAYFPDVFSMPQKRFVEKFKFYTRAWDDSAVEENQRFALTFPRDKAYQRVGQGEVYRVQQNEELKKIVKNTKSFMPEILTPISIPDQDLNSICVKLAQELKENGEFSIESRDQLVANLKRVNYDHLPKIAMWLAFEVESNDEQIWAVLDEYICKDIHLLTFSDICLAEYASQHLKPKRTTGEMNALIFDKIKSLLPSADSHNFMLASQCFRKKNTLRWSMMLTDTYMQNKDLYLKECGGDETKQAKLLCNLLYSITSNKGRYLGKNGGVLLHAVKTIVNEADYELRDSIEFLDGNHLSRLVQALYLSGAEDLDPLLWRIEHQMIDLKDELAPDQIASIFRAFSQMYKGKGYGRKETFIIFEPIILKHLESFSTRELSNIMYFYGFYEYGNPELHKAFVEKISKDIHTYDYQTLYNVIFYLMFQDIKDQDLWQNVINVVIDQEETLSMNIYRPFKYSKFYIAHHCPDLDLGPYIDKFWHAERRFDGSKDELAMSNNNDLNNF